MRYHVALLLERKLPQNASPTESTTPVFRMAAEGDRQAEDSLPRSGGMEVSHLRGEPAENLQSRRWSRGQQRSRVRSIDRTPGRSRRARLGAGHQHRRISGVQSAVGRLRPITEAPADLTGSAEHLAAAIRVTGRTRLDLAEQADATRSIATQFQAAARLTRHPTGQNM